MLPLGQSYYSVYQPFFTCQIVKSPNWWKVTANVAGDYKSSLQLVFSAVPMKLRLRRRKETIKWLQTTAFSIISSMIFSLSLQSYTKANRQHKWRVGRETGYKRNGPTQSLELFELYINGPRKVYPERFIHIYVSEFEQSKQNIFFFAVFLSFICNSSYNYLGLATPWMKKQSSNKIDL